VPSVWGSLAAFAALYGLLLIILVFFLRWLARQPVDVAKGA
jgi:cytochrome bd-type quinol oxidase subunit 1